VQLVEERQHVLAVLRVEVAGWFVRQQQRRFVDQRAGDGDALALAPRELGRVVPQAVRAVCCAFCPRLRAAISRPVGARRIHPALRRRGLFWCPVVGRPADGAYVRYPERELLDALAHASRDAGALVIAEDLGTVPEGFSEAIQARGLLGSRVLLFERDGGGFRPADHYPRRCLATASTHDLPPLAALRGHADLELRRSVGQIADDAQLEQLRAERRELWCALRERLERDARLDPNAPADSLGPAVARFLGASPAALVGLQLDDLAGETEPINLPGVPATHHPSWTRRLHCTLEALFDTATARHTLTAARETRPRVAAR